MAAVSKKVPVPNQDQVPNQDAVPNQDRDLEAQLPEVEVPKEKPAKDQSSNLAIYLIGGALILGVVILCGWRYKVIHRKPFTSQFFGNVTGNVPGKWKCANSDCRSAPRRQRLIAGGPDGPVYLHVLQKVKVFFGMTHMVMCNDCWDPEFAAWSAPEGGSLLDSEYTMTKPQYGSHDTTPSGASRPPGMWEPEQEMLDEMEGVNREEEFSNEYGHKKATLGHYRKPESNRNDKFRPESSGGQR